MADVQSNVQTLMLFDERIPNKMSHVGAREPLLILLTLHLPLVLGLLGVHRPYAL